MVQFVYSLQDVSPELGHARLVRVSTVHCFTMVSWPQQNWQGTVRSGRHVRVMQESCKTDRIVCTKSSLDISAVSTICTVSPGDHRTIFAQRSHCMSTVDTLHVLGNVRACQSIHSQVLSTLYRFEQKTA